MPVDRASRKQIRDLLIHGLILAALFLQSCSAAQPPQPTATEQPTTTATMEPSVTPSSTATSLPTSSPTPVPTQTSTPVPPTTGLALLINGSRNEWFSGAIETANHDTVLVGATNSPKFGTELDAYVVRLDASGKVLWQKNYGGLLDDGASAVLELKGGDLMVFGYTGSFGKGAQDGWILRLSPQGDLRWQMSYGGPGDEVIYSAIQMPNGQIVIAGHTSSSGAGGYDAWILRISDNGSLLSEKTYGGPLNDRATALAPTSDGGVLFVGATSSFGSGDSDIWIVRLGPSGNLVDQKTIGGSGADYATDILPLGHDYWYIAGATASTADGTYDAWVGMIKPDDTLAWQKTYGGKGDDFAEKLAPEPGGGLVFLGETHSAAPAGSNLQTGLDAWLVLADQNGLPLRQTVFRQSGDDAVGALAATSDLGYILAGWTKSQNTKGPDAWAVKVDESGTAIGCTGFVTVKLDTAKGNLSVTMGGGAPAIANSSIEYTEGQQHDSGLETPNLCKAETRATPTPSAVGAPAWALSFPKNDAIVSTTVMDAARLPDGSYVLAGAVTKGPAWPGKSDMWLAHMDTDGTLAWQQAYGTDDASEVATDVLVLSDGRILVAGISSDRHFILLGVDENGQPTWSRSIPSQNVPATASIAETSNGSILLAGASSSYSYGLWRFSPLGDLDWRFGGKLVSDNNSRWTVSSLTLTPVASGGFFLAGAAISQDTGQNVVVIIRLDKLGNTSWLRSYQLAVPSSHAKVSLAALPDGGFIAASIQDPSTNKKPWIFRATEDGSPTWAKSLDLAELNGISVLNDRVFLAGAGIDGAVSAALDMDGNLLWKSGFKSAQDSLDSAAAVVALPDGGVVLAGNTAATGGQGFTAFALREDANGFLKGCALVKPAAFDVGPLDMDAHLLSGFSSSTSTLEGDVNSSLLSTHAVPDDPQSYCPAK
jgi:uncharacterized delta-60 repeat protein